MPISLTAHTQADADAAQLTNEIRNVRAQLSSKQPSLPPAELDRLADVLGRSNYLAQAIAVAFERNDETNAARLLAQFTGSVDGLNLYGQPLLMRAASQNRIALVNLLLDRKANPNFASPAGDTPLPVALQTRSWAIARLLVQAGADLTRTNARSPLGLLVDYWQAGRKDYDGQMKQLLREMLNRGADPFAPANGNPSRAIIEAALANVDPTLGQLLLTNRPDATRRTPGGNTALHLAALRGATNEIDFLLDTPVLPGPPDNGGIALHQPLRFTINETNNDGLTPLQFVVGLSHDQVQAPAMFFGFPGVMGRRGGRMPPPAFSMPDFLLSRGATLDVWSAAGLGKTNELSSILSGTPALANARDGLGRTPLHYAALASQFNAAKLLIRAGADTSAVTTKPIVGISYEQPIPAGATALHLASRRGDAALVRMLLRSQAPVNLPDAAGDTPLHLAARQWQTNIATALVQHHAFLDTTNDVGQTPLRAAVESATSANVELLLNAGARQEIGMGSNTLLHIAAARGATEVIKVLLHHGLAVDARDGDGNTPFELAVKDRQWGAMTLLASKGANVNAANSHGDTALHVLSVEQMDSTWHNVEMSRLEKWERDWMYRPGFRRNTITNLAHWKVIKLLPPPMGTNSSLTEWLLEHRANPNLTNHLGQTPLHVLCQNHWLTYDFNQATQRVNFLLKAGARVDVRDVQGLTPLHVAASNAPPAMLLSLAQHVAKSDTIRDTAGRTPLHYATLSRNFAATNASVLIHWGADVNARDNLGRTPLHEAVTNRANDRLKMTTILLDHHANPNARDLQGCTPLHLLAQAMRNGDYFSQASETLEALLKAGANAALLDNEGQTIIHRWCDQGNSHSGNVDMMLQQLLSHHPDFANLTNAAGETPLLTALRGGDTTAVQWLMQHGADPGARNAQGQSAILLAQKDERGYLANVVHPPGTSLNFYWSLITRNQQQFDLWLKAEPALAKITFNNGETPMEVLTRRGRPAPEFIVRLTALGAPPDPLSELRLGHIDSFRRLMRAQTNMPSTLLFEAISLKHFDDIKDLALARGDLKALDREGHTLLYRAARESQNNVADWLRQQGVTTTFVDAVALGDTNRLANLWATNQSPDNLPPNNPRDMLMVAARFDQPGSIRFLLAQGVGVDARGAEDMTALHVAANWGAARAAQALLLAGADPNARQSRTFGPLHIAAMSGHTEVVRQLLDHGAAVNLRLTNQINQFINMPGGSTPLHWAANYGRLEVVQLLLQRGADVNAANAAGETSLDLARDNEHVPAYHVFLGNGTAGYRVPPLKSKAWAEIEAVLVQAGGVHKHPATAP